MNQVETLIAKKQARTIGQKLMMMFKSVQLKNQFQGYHLINIYTSLMHRNKRMVAFAAQLFAGDYKKGMLAVGPVP